MRHILPFVFSSFLAATSLCEAEEMPVVINNQLNRLERIFGKTATADYRAEIMILSSKIAADPPPNFESFRSVASAIVIVSSTSCHEQITDIIKNLRSSDWRKSEVRGYPRWRFRIVGPWDATLFDVLVDYDMKTICIGDRWFRISGQLAELLTKNFLQNVAAMSDLESYKPRN